MPRGRAPGHLDLMASASVDGAALQPLAHARTAFSAGTTRSMGLVPHLCCRTVDLNPPMVGVELLRISASQNVKRFVRVALQVDAAIGMLMRVPVGGDEIRYEDVTDLVAVLVAFDRVADLSRPEDAFGILIGTVQPRIHSHLAELVRCSDADACVVGVERLHEHLGYRQPLICQIMVGERSGLIAIIQEGEPPAARGRHLVLWDENEGGGGDAPEPS